METVCDLVREQLDDNMSNDKINALCFEVFKLSISDALLFETPEKIARYIVDYVLLTEDV